MAEGNKQNMEGMKLTGNATQSSDQPDVSMSMKNVSAQDALQTQAADAETVNVLGWSGRGKWAVVGLIIVALVAVWLMYS